MFVDLSEDDLDQRTLEDVKDTHCETELKVLSPNIAFSSFDLFSLLLNLFLTLNYLLSILIISEISDTLLTYFV